VKQIGLAVLNYESINGAFPPSSIGMKSGNYGFSWLGRILAYTEQENIYNQLDLTGTKPGSNNVVGWLGGGGNMWNANLLNNMTFSFLRCPSSPLPVNGVGFDVEYDKSNTGNNLPVQDPNYTGICGGGFPAPRGTYPLSHVKGSPPDTAYAPGWASTGGIIVLDVAITTGRVSDGLSNTMIIGEQSDWCLTSNGQNRDCRSDCGHGFFMGGTWGDTLERVFNTTCVINRLGDKSFGSEGVRGNCAANRAIQSAHPNGAIVGMADGSVHFLSESINIYTLYNLANRQDGNVLGDF
jgi:prepilin-type processing-associated H-X9-DG protein